jgi:hypothetical protein
MPGYTLADVTLHDAWNDLRFAVTATTKAAP